MTSHAFHAPHDDHTENGLTRDRGKLAVLGVATVVAIYLCYRLALPFLPALVWAVTGAVVTHPLVDWLRRRIKSPTIRAGVAVVLVTAALFVPVGCLVYFAAAEIVAVAGQWDPDAMVAAWRELLQDHPWLARAEGRVSRNLNLAAIIDRVAGRIEGLAGAILAGTANGIIQLGVAMFALYYFYRDEDIVSATLHRLSPLSRRETTTLMRRLNDTIHATVVGKIGVSAIQGALGGIAFWMLQLPGAFVWGVVMGVMSIVPVLGAFVVWGPAALFLYLEGDWVRASILVAFGTIVVGLADNVLYPALIGNRLRQHTVVAFIGILGGIVVFGASGIVLGPVLITLTLSLLEAWRRRTVDDQLRPRKRPGPKIRNLPSARST